MSEDPSVEKEERRAGKDRRVSGDRRAGVDRRTGKDRRKSPGRRASDISEHRKVERRINEYPMSDEELEFIQAINAYKQRYNKPFPTWSEILHILKSLGYEKPDA
jgi:hypothetical protein